MGKYEKHPESLQAERSGDRIPVGWWWWWWGKAIFSIPVQTGPGAHAASYTVGTGSFPGVKWPVRGVNIRQYSLCPAEIRDENLLNASHAT
jgi:hypothetical protein